MLIYQINRYNFFTDPTIFRPDPNATFLYNFLEILIKLNHIGNKLMLLSIDNLFFLAKQVLWFKFWSLGVFTYGRTSVNQIATKSMAWICILWQPTDFIRIVLGVFHVYVFDASITFINLVPEYSWYSGLSLIFGIWSKALMVEEIWQFKVFKR